VGTATYFVVVVVTGGGWVTDQITDEVQVTDDDVALGRGIGWYCTC